eukprot:11568261-Alexandrium_andersonii.AAC.1
MLATLERCVTVTMTGPINTLHPQRSSGPPPPGTRGPGDPESLQCSKPPPGIRGRGSPEPH